MSNLHSMAGGTPAVIEADKAAAITYWRTDGPPLELQRAFASYREAVALEFEAKFWATVDADGLCGAPSDMWTALEQIARAARNRDMWKGQCERQAVELTKLRALLNEQPA